MAVSGVSGRFQPLSRTQRQVPTRYSPVRRSPPEDEALDLHVLGAPPAFVLSQDQTLSFIPDINWHKRSKPPPRTKTPTGAPAEPKARWGGLETHQKTSRQRPTPPPEHPLTQPPTMRNNSVIPAKTGDNKPCPPNPPARRQRPGYRQPTIGTQGGGARNQRWRRRTSPAK